MHSTVIFWILVIVYTDQQAFLSHHKTQLSKMLSTEAERLGSVKPISSVRLGIFLGNTLLKVQYEASSQDDTVNAK